jgi:opacity protein-like surface antigen
MKSLALGATMMLAAGAAAAQDAPWTYSATLYGWLPGMTTAIETDQGTIESDSSASDALSNLDMVFMGTFSAQRDRWGFAGDLLYLDLSNERDTPLGLFGNARVGIKTTAISGYALYRVTTDPAVAFDLGAGFRAFDLETELAVSPGSLPGFSQDVGGSWVDPLVAARLAVPISDAWTLTGFADWGGSGGDDQTWQVFGSVKYDINEKWATQVGYRFMEISKELDGHDVSVDLGGPVIAMALKF